MEQDCKLFIAWTTLPGKEQAQGMARGAVEENLAVCCQVSGPITSYYHWAGKTQEDLEFRIMFKVLARKVTQLEKWVLAHHAYQTPQWVAVKADRVGDAYMAWAESPA